MAASAWICPSCTRRIPRTVDVCRCGHEWTGSEEAVVDPSPDSVVGRSAASSPGLPTLVVGGALVLIAAVIAFVAFGRPRPLDPTAQRGVVQPAAPPDASATVEAEPDSRVPQWPDDPTLWKNSPAPGPATSPAPPASPVTTRARSLEEVISASLPAVVLVETPGGRGTGFFVSPDTLVTNAHVVEGNSYVTVKLSTGEALTGRVVQRSDDLDLAAIRTNDSRPGQATLPLASSREARIGTEVIAIGSPLGLQNTVTRGIVSALRQVGAVVLVQTDAAINPGNSGGALVNAQGELIGVNVAIASAGGSGAGTQSGSIGVGFAIPSNLAKRVADEIIADGSATHGLLGATVKDATSDTSATVGAEINEVTDGGAAETAGLKPGDVITSFNDTPITGSTDLTAQVRALAAGTTTSLTYVRGGNAQTVDVKLGSLK